MLPHRLSNGICSLNAGTDRFALSCLMDLDEKGNVIGHRICESVVRIDRRMTYTAVNAILQAKKGAYDEPLPLLIENETEEDMMYMSKKEAR